MKLDSGTIHMMRLALRDGDADGWAKVSKALWPTTDSMPTDLVEKRPSDNGGGHIRLTECGKAVIRYT